MSHHKNLDPVDVQIGQKLKKCRQKRHFSISQIAKFLNLPTDEIRLYEDGYLSIAITDLYRLSALYNVNITYFFDDQVRETKRHDEIKEKTITQIQKIEESTITLKLLELLEDINRKTESKTD